MKKTILLTSVFAAITACGYAQGLEQSAEQKVDMRKTSMMRMENMKMSDATPVERNAKQSKPRKTAANGVYFTRPKGTLVTAWTEEGSGYYTNSIIVPPYYEVTFKNMSTDPAATTWALDNDNKTDMTEDATENNDLNFGLVGYGCYNPQFSSTNGWYTPSYYLPFLASGSIEYRFGEVNNENYNANRHAYIRVDSVGTYSFIDENTVETYYGWGRLVSSYSENYLFGSGKRTLTNSDGTTTDCTCRGVVEYFPKPASPLYVERMALEAYTSTEVLKNGAKLGLRVVEAKEKEDGTLEMTDNVIAELAATADDVNLWGTSNSSYTTSGKVNIVNISFRNRVQDEFGSSYDEPFVIDKPFAVYVYGFESADVDINIPCPIEATEDHMGQGVEAVLVDGDQVWAQYIYGGDPMTLPIRFIGCFDYIEAQDELYGYDDNGNIADTYSNLNVLRVSADGATIATEGADEDHDFGAAIFYTGFPWYDSEGLENYYVLDAPEWITEIKAVDYYSRNYSNYRTGMAEVTFTIEALPAGVTGRSAALYFEGKGYKSELPVIILQGDAKLEDVTGVTAAKADTKAANAAMFNLAGQRVDNSFKGLVIKNGKKFMNK